MQEMLRLPPKPITWILLADGKQARFYNRIYAEKIIPLSGNLRHRHYKVEYAYELALIPEMTLQAESVENYEFGRAQRGRVHESTGAAHHMSEPHEAIDDKIRRHFLENIAQQLQDAKKAKLFDHLVLVMPERSLAELKRIVLHDVMDSIVAELPKNLTHCEEKVLIENLRDIA